MSDNSPTTESRLDPDRWIDQLPPAEALAVMLDNQAEAIPALYAALPAIDSAVTALHQRLRAGRG
ncbi:MAG: N-acetylmuramic acid 6-phosphate etherase, partial [Candidatus Puniceispirillaceae bacterium]